MIVIDYSKSTNELVNEYYQTEQAATQAAEEITKRWNDDDDYEAFNAYAIWSASRDCYIIRERPFIPGTLGSSNKLVL